MADNEITKEQEAFIEITAQRVADKLESRLVKHIDDRIEIHTLNCQNKRLTGFKAVIIGILSAVATQLGNFLLSK